MEKQTCKFLQRSLRTRQQQTQLRVLREDQNTKTALLCLLTVKGKGQ